MTTIGRRGFLSGMTSVLAASALPAFAKDEMGLFPARGKFERLSIAYQHIHLGLKTPFSVLHVSDTHLTAVDERDEERREFLDKRRRTFGGCQEESFCDTLAWAKKNVDYVIHTGDLIDCITEANLDLVRKYAGDAKIAGSVGNHEFQRRKPGEAIRRTSEYNALSRERLNGAYPFDVTFQSTVINGVNFISMEQVYGFVVPEQVERFRSEVKRGLPIILCMHVPFFLEPVWRAHEKFRRNRGKLFRSAVLSPPPVDYQRQMEDPVTRDFIAYLKREELLRGILCGHLHIDVQARFSPTAMEYVVGGNFIPHGEEVLFT